MHNKELTFLLKSQKDKGKKNENTQKSVQLQNQNTVSSRAIFFL